MYPLTVDEAEKYVRKNLDELNENESVMADLDDVDSNEFRTIVARTLPESINYVHGNAPAYLLDGEILTPVELGGAKVVDGAITVKVCKDVLRLVAFQAASGNLIGPVVTQVYPETSSVGRAQKSPYTRGDFDNPRLIVSQGQHWYEPQTPSGRSFDILEEEEIMLELPKSEFKYYSALGTSDKIVRFEYLPRYKYSDSTKTYKVAEQLVEEVINRLTGEVLVIYGRTDLASIFLTRANFGRQASTEQTE